VGHCRTQRVGKGQSSLTCLGPPGRVMLDTNILNELYDEGEYICDGDPGNRGYDEIDPELIALRDVFQLARRLQFQFVTSPLSVAEVVNIQGVEERRGRLGWFLEMLDYWTIELDGSGDRVSKGGVVRHRFKLTPELERIETGLLAIPDFRRDPFDRLLLLHSRMANCDVFLTQDRRTVWRHRKALKALDIAVVTPSEYWSLIAPYAALA
jgi:hypothetical protein